MITRRILVTEVYRNGELKVIYGRFDAVALAAAGWQIQRSQFRHYKMTEEKFAETGTLINTEE